MLRCQDRKVQAMDLKLNAEYQRTLSKLAARDPQRGPALVPALRRSQRAWLNFMETNRGLYAALPMGDEQWTALYFADCKVDPLAERMDELRSIAENE